MEHSLAVGGRRTLAREGVDAVGASRAVVARFRRALVHIDLALRPREASRASARVSMVATNADRLDLARVGLLMTVFQLARVEVIDVTR